ERIPPAVQVAGVGGVDGSQRVDLGFVVDEPFVLRGVRPPRGQASPRHRVSRHRSSDRPAQPVVLDPAFEPRLEVHGHRRGHLLHQTTLSPRQRELIILRVGAVRRSPYEWAQHVVLAGDVGIDPDELARIAEGSLEGWSPLEAAMLRAVDELVAHAGITDETWAVLVAELDAKQLLDLIFTVGSYDMLAMLLVSFRTELDDDLRRYGNGLLASGDR